MKRVCKTGDEHDVHTKWRHMLTSYQRPGAASKVKRRSRRRERREGKRHAESDPRCD